jgi:hypothetical protein
MSFWCCAQISVPRQNLALHYLALSGYETYLPRIRARRTAPRHGGVPAVSCRRRRGSGPAIACGSRRGRWRIISHLCRNAAA